MVASLLVAILVLGGIACSTPPPIRKGPAAEKQSFPEHADPASSAQASAPPPSEKTYPALPASSVAPPETVLGPRVQIGEVKGRNEDFAKALFAPARTQLAECARGGGGTIQIRITSSDSGSTSMDVVPGASIDTKMRRCVLEALSTIDVPDQLSQTSPSSRPGGFSSLVTVQW